MLLVLSLENLANGLLVHGTDSSQQQRVSCMHDTVHSSNSKETRACHHKKLATMTMQARISATAFVAFKCVGATKLLVWKSWLETFLMRVIVGRQVDNEILSFFLPASFVWSLA